MKTKFIDAFVESVSQKAFIKMTLSSLVNKNKEEFKTVFIRPFESKKGLLLSWVYRYPRKDVTQNYTLEESKNRVLELLGSYFSQADLYTQGKDYFLKTDGKEKLTVKENTVAREVKASHNKEKFRLVPESTPFLQLLDVTSKEGFIKKEKRDKFIQINKFLEFFETATETLKSDKVKVLDMGSGKGYLTFAMYYYLMQKTQAEVIGVEYRQDMVDLCNALAKKAQFEGLRFEQGTIADYDFDQTDVLIALHACDTATDEALYKAIQSNAQVIMVSPCCHKQVRKAMNTTGIQSQLTKFGILKERTAEMLTDIIRANILEVYGYQTQIFEFVNSEHTPKNLMITAVKKRESKAQDPQAWNSIEELKNTYGISYHHLQRMLGF